ncbi:MAG: hypothetical protein S0880_20705 [Actinomycetota bacterium]|nr:hypothetical protein [Actinomycetota bacterium]
MGADRPGAGDDRRVEPPPRERLRKTGRGHVDSYAEGRRCEHPGCTTALSRYNSTVWCSVHELGRPGQSSGARRS